jgi:hypothetical protein
VGGWVGGGRRGDGGATGRVAEAGARIGQGNSPTIEKTTTSPVLAELHRGAVVRGGAGAAGGAADASAPAPAGVAEGLGGGGVSGTREQGVSARGG